MIIGDGEYRYEILHYWAQLPDRFTWQTTHGVAVDSAGLLYVIHEGRLEQDDHPSIFVFDPEGAYVRSFGAEFQGGGHGIAIRNEGGQDFLYVCAYHQQRSFAKLDTRGELVWRKGAPMESGIYSDGEDAFPRDPVDNPWGRDRFLPTNIVPLTDGGFLLADGYGAYRIHRYDRDANWIGMFGKPGNDDDRAGGKFNLPHGICIDDRGADPLVAVADRQFNRLQWFKLNGEHHKTMDGFLLPANLNTFGEVMVVPELVARLTLLDKNNNVIAHLGNDVDRLKADSKFEIRSDESTWRDGKFVHPHDTCFDADGNLFVAEWVRRGRVTKLRRLS